MRRSRISVAVVALLAAVGVALVHVPAGAQGGKRKLKVHISVDMEGVAGTVTADQLSPTGFEYGRFREFMTNEALAAVEAAKEAGATEIIVADSHGNGENLLIEHFPADVRVIRSWPRPLAMMAGVDQDIDAAIFIGYHASTTNATGVRAHTFSSATLARVALNGVEMSEGAWNAAIAGQYGVPVIMISGDDAAVKEVRSVVGNIEAAEVKTTLGFHAASTLTPEASCALIGKAVKAAFARRAAFKPYVVNKPAIVDVTFKNYLPSEVLAYLPMFERTGSHSIRFSAKDMTEASRIMHFITEYRTDLTP